LGLNLTYDDLDNGQKKFVQLAPDPAYAPENPAPKKFLTAEFVVGAARVLEFESALNANHFFPGDERKFSLAIQSPEPQTGWQVRMFLTTPRGNVQSKTPLSFEQGMNILNFPIDLEKTPTGIYELSLGLIDDKGTLRYTDDRRFFLLDKEEFGAYDAKLEEIRKGEVYGKDVIFRESLPTVEVRLKWVRDFMEKSPPFADLEPVQEWQQEIKDLFNLLDAGKPALFPPGRVSRLGYRSEADGALRSYSVFVPDWYSEKIPLPLLVTLSGRAANERRAIFSLTAGYFGPRIRKKAGDFFILAPETGDPAGWYTGGSAERVIETIQHLAKIYSVNLKGVVVDGFANGGYGALRLALQNPGTFRGVIMRSGIFVPPPHSGAESIPDMLDRAKGLDVLIVHGERDKGAPLDEARRVVGELQQAKANVSFIEVKGTRPEDLERWDDIFGWLRETFGDTAVDLKPPKEEKAKKPEEKKSPYGPRP
jgi:pimeloyl-ACP methyl ester carboxylesterase